MRVAFAVDDSLPSLGALLKVLDLPEDFGSFPQSAPPDDDVTVDLSMCDHLGCLSVATLIALRRAFSHHRRTLSLVPPPESHSALYGYCLFSGLLEEFGVGPPPTEHQKNVTVPGTVFTEIGGERQVLRLVHRFVSLTSDDEELLQTSLQELMINTRDHAESSFGGVLSARVHINQGELRAAVVDAGVGVRRSLSRRNELRSDDEALRLAIEEGVSARSVRRNMGMGLPSIRHIAAGNGGELLLASGHASLRAGSRVATASLEHPFPGTLALLRFKVSSADATGKNG